ncbi:MAG: tryptophan synthase subunit alpha [Campylobacterales bacterium]
MKKLVSYITASLPDREFSIDLIHGLKEAGSDIVELGMPFSDPVADGPVIEEANLRAIKAGFKLEDIFYITEKTKDVDIAWMGYLNPFIRKGFDYFLDGAKKSGAKAFIIPDMPYEEVSIVAPMCENSGVELVSFIAPTHSEKRIETIAKNSRFFIYLVAFAGITGASKDSDLSSIIEHIKRYSSTPIYLGFGVNRDNAKQKAKNVDGVIVGSAFVKYLIDESLTNSEKINKITRLSLELKERINS